MKDHVPRHLLERLVVDDPRAPVRPVLRVHIASCDRCSMRQRALEAARSGHLAKYDVRAFAATVLARAAQPEPVRRRGLAALSPAWIMLAAGLMILAPVVGVLWYTGAGSTLLGLSDAGPLRITLQRGNEARPLRDGSQLESGDRLSVSYSLDRPRHLLLLGVDAGGTIRRYFPSDASQAEPLVAARSAQLPVDLSSDTARGDEHLFALVSDAPLDEVAVRGSLAAVINRSRARGLGGAGLATLDVHAEQQHIWFRRP